MGLIIKEEVPRRVIMVGDPKRVDVLANLLDNVRELNYVRGYKSVVGKFRGFDIAIVTHGMGVPSATIVAEEVIDNGGRYLVRLGTTGALKKWIDVGDAVIATAASYLPGGFYTQYFKEMACVAAASDHFLTRAIVDEVSRTGLKYHVGPIVTSDALYAEDPDFASRWGSRGMLSVEMEAAGILTVAQAKEAKASIVLLVSNSLVKESKWCTTEDLADRFVLLGKAIMEALIKF